jgi:hypothetical protein
VAAWLGSRLTTTRAWRSPRRDPTPVDKGIFVPQGVLDAARVQGVRWLVHYSPDNYLLQQNASRHLWRGLARYDLVVTTKRSNVALLGSAGARRVLLSGNAFDPEMHRPLVLDDAARAVHGADVSFVGRREPARERMLDAVRRAAGGSACAARMGEKALLAPRARGRVRARRDLRRRLRARDRARR